MEVLGLEKHVAVAVGPLECDFDGFLNADGTGCFGESLEQEPRESSKSSKPTKPPGTKLSRGRALTAAIPLEEWPRLQ